jgi:hypothetical protein
MGYVMILHRTLTTEYWAGRKGDRVMPIGFWAISRNELKDIWACRTRKPLSIEELNKLCQELPEKLNNVIYEEMDKIQISRAKG